MNNDTTRNAIIRQRSDMDKHQCAELSADITANLLEQAIFDQANRIAVYLSQRNEVHTEKIIHEIWAQGKACYLPVLAPDTPNSLHFIPYEKDTALQANRFGILEPAWDLTACLPAEDFDLIIAPLVAFDEQCHRIGMGAGYYDRTFAFLNAQPRPNHPKLVGLAYELQKLENIQAQPWDIDLNAVFTENKIYQRSFK